MTVFSTVLAIYETWFHCYSKKFTDRALHLNPFTVINEFYIFKNALLQIYNEFEHWGSKLWKSFKTALIMNKSSSPSCKHDEIPLQYSQISLVLKEMPYIKDTISGNFISSSK